MSIKDNERRTPARGMRVLPWLAAGSILSALTHAASPALDDYSRGISISAASEQPLVELELPQEVYQTITSANLADVRVFNADGKPVPHAFCAAPETSAPIV